VTTQDGGSTARDDRSAFWCGGSVFNTGGQRLNEIDLSTHRRPRTLADMTDADWELVVAEGDPQRRAVPRFGRGAGGATVAVLGTPIQEISRFVEHSSTAVTELL
jgi:hypothetical protein